jgi:hypothetical protein
MPSKVACENESMRHIAIFPVILALLLPARMPAQYARRLPSAATATAGPYNGPAVSFNGTVKTLTKKELIVDLDPADSSADRQSLTFRVSRKTKFLKGDQPIQPSDIEVGTHISLDATRDGDQKFSALNVMLAVPAKPADKPTGK